MKTSSFLKVTNLSPQLLVKDINRSIEFYTDILDFKVDFKHDDFYCGISKNDFTLHLKLVDDFPNKDKNYQNLDLVFTVLNIDDLYENIQSKSVKIIEPIRSMSYGKEFYISDLDGYHIGFIETI